MKPEHAVGAMITILIWMWIFVVNEIYHYCDNLIIAHEACIEDKDCMITVDDNRRYNKCNK